ncbi:unnamed protein product [Acanthoscelides obtectus]|uniref:Uncharacterized protein n=1 Tax=Acanthoscelides obtectus TaxID=200917 RepID=A0A9P0LG50_ACAOB|nr:unnamed protein product [Acanthoscelides obtectus]CAK1637628.1 hypothetical protein AOBTE_LOCUS10098 [Acanthoscelides obtectus]
MDDKHVATIAFSIFQRSETVLEVHPHSEAEPQMQEANGQYTAGQRREKQDETAKGYRVWVRVRYWVHWKRI